MPWENTIQLQSSTATVAANDGVSTLGFKSILISNSFKYVYYSDNAICKYS